MGPNNLIKELSPYLLQHAYNPVNWFAWKKEAFDKAINENKPIFLSIGYSTCHWCHVMEKESFEDEEVAKILNENFISIKVDREERPDIDSIYMTTCQIITGRGGWPLSVFLTPNKKPFFAGTYFPKENRYGRIGFKELLLKISDAWINNQNEILKSSEEITQSINLLFTENQRKELNENILDNAFNYFSSNFDNINGGFGKAPKFPSPHNLIFLLNYSKLKNNETALNMVIKTLQKMRLGGIYDQIGYGFHRYSTDKEWLVPHFEKMLYDQAMLIIAFSYAYQISHNDLFKDTVFEIFEYLLSNMKSNEGAFYSAEDADSEGEEGKFYLWTYNELKSLLSKDDFLFTQEFFNIKKEGNYFDEITHAKNGNNILHQSFTIDEFSSINKLNPTEIKKRISLIRKTLYNERKKRIPPFKDEKILTDWNSLLIASFSISGRIFNNENLIENAKQIINFIEDKLKSRNGELIHRYKDGQADINATLDDYAFYIWGLIEFYQTTFDFNLIEKVTFYVEQAIKKFYDEINGGFFLANKNYDELIVKTKDLYDGAIPSGNSVMIYNLIKLNTILFDNKYKEIIDKTFSYFSNQLVNSPASNTFLLTSFMNYNNQSELIIIYKDKNEIHNIFQKLRKLYLPNITIITFYIEEIPTQFSSYSILNNSTTYYLCKNFICELPTNNLDEILKMLKN